jgi:hypothetical protein
MNRPLRPQREITMEVLRYMHRKFERVLSHDMFERFRKDKQPATDRLCKYGHPVFAGNNLCTYGHHAA